MPIVKVLQDSEENYVAFRDICFYKDMLVSMPTSFSEKIYPLSNSVRSIHNYVVSSQNTDFFVYYIETNKDINFATGEKSGFYEYLQDNLDLPANQISRLRTDSYDDYSKNFLRTDHHWNGNGAYTAYMEICKMLGISPLVRSGTHTVEDRYLGTRAAGVEGVDREAFTVNIFNYPDMDIIINEEPADDYGLQTEFINNELYEFSYGSVFGPDCREIIFYTGNAGKNLLVVGDSYDNAIIKALASGFSKTYCIDLRAFNAYSFDLTNYVEQKQIDSVLFIGGIDFFTTILY